MEKYTGTPEAQTLYPIDLVLIKELLQQKQKQNLGLSNILDSHKLQLCIYGINLTLLNQTEKCSWIQGEMKGIGENTNLGNPYYHMLNKEVKLNTINNFKTFHTLLNSMPLYSIKMLFKILSKLVYQLLSSGCRDT